MISNRKNRQRESQAPENINALLDSIAGACKYKETILGTKLAPHIAQFIALEVLPCDTDVLTWRP